MKERIETRNDSFVDYAGQTHYFTMVAISKELPKKTSDFKDIKNFEGCEEVYYEVSEYIEDYGTNDYLGSVTKVLHLGVAICNPTEEFDERKGIEKAIARARNSKPALYSTNLGTINGKVVKALLEQECEFLKQNPGKYIKGYDESRKTYERKIKMNKMFNAFTDFELKVAEALENNPNIFDNVKEYLKYQDNQRKGCQK